MTLMIAKLYKAHCPFAQHFEEPSTDQPVGLRQFDEAERCLAMLSRLGGPVLQTDSHGIYGYLYIIYDFYFVAESLQYLMSTIYNNSRSNS